MNSSRFHPMLWGAVLLFGLAAYAGSYRWLVAPIYLSGPESATAFYTVFGWKTNMYGAEQPSLRTFYSPANWVDRRIRPHEWQFEVP
jgi:hypothetical protein